MLFSLDTIYSADSAEFCPYSEYNDILACGTYQLEAPEPDKQASEPTEEDLPSSAPHKRLGRCLLYRWSDATSSLTEIYRLDQPAILDMKWSHVRRDTGPVLAIADAEGHVALQRWDAHENTLVLEQNISCAASNVLCLSIDWSNRRYEHTEAAESLVVSRSDGYLALASPRESEYQTTDEWHAHDFEPWIAAWNYWDTNMIYSGGDDCKLKGWDKRQGFDQPAFTNKRFDAGVTTIQSNPHIEHIFAVGSYDSTVRIFDARQAQRPVIETDVGGGAWRVKWHPQIERKNDLLVACMHDGFKVVRFSPAEGEAGGSFTSSETTSRNDEHESLAYGADWRVANVAGDETSNSTIIAGCSFYDHRLSVWRG